MKKHPSPDDIKKDLDILISKINALEVSAPDDYEKEMVKVLRFLLESQVRTVNEFEHIKKAIDLVTLELFDVKNKINL